MIDGSTAKMVLTMLRSASAGRLAMMVSVIMLTCAVLAFERGMIAMFLDAEYSDSCRFDDDLLDCFTPPQSNEDY